MHRVFHAQDPSQSVHFRHNCLRQTADRQKHHYFIDKLLHSLFHSYFSLAVETRCLNVHETDLALNWSLKILISRYSQLRFDQITAGKTLKSTLFMGQYITNFSDTLSPFQVTNGHRESFHKKTVKENK